MNKERMNSKLEDIIKRFLEELSNGYACLYFSQCGLKILSEVGMKGVKFGDIPTLTLGVGSPVDPNPIVLYHETGSKIHKNICEDYPRRVINHFIIEMYESWEKTRAVIATILDKKRDEIKSDIFGDVRNARNDIVHNSCKVDKVKSNKLWKINSDSCVFHLTMDDIDFILSEMFNYLNSLLPEEDKLIDRSLSIRGKEIHRSCDHKFA